jgi:Cupin domain
MNDSYTISIVRLYSDEEGESHFSDEIITLALAEFAPPAPAIFVSPPVAATRSLFLALPDGWSGPSHPSPQRQLMVMMSGAIEVTVSGGESRTFAAGDAILIEDITGKGHTTRAAAPDALAMVVHT